MRMQLFERVRPIGRNSASRSDGILSRCCKARNVAFDGQWRQHKTATTSHINLVSKHNGCGGVLFPPPAPCFTNATLDLACDVKLTRKPVISHEQQKRPLGPLLKPECRALHTRFPRFSRSCSEIALNSQTI